MSTTVTTAAVLERHRKRRNNWPTFTWPTRAAFVAACVLAMQLGWLIADIRSH